MDKISVVVTVLNEEKTIKKLIVSLINQSRKADEIIIVDGGSTDQTIKIINSYKVYKNYKVITGKYNRSEGRNIGVLAAKGEIIVFTDAGCIPERDWLTNITSPLIPLLSKEREGRRPGEVCEVVAGYYRGLPQNIFEKCLVPYVLVMPDQIGEEFLPSTRSMAIKKELFLRAGGFDKNLWHNEDYAFAVRLKNAGINFYFAPKAIVDWFPRKDLKSAAWMFLRFAIGDAQAGILRPKVKFLAVRYYFFVFLVFLYWPMVTLLVGYLVWAVLKNYKYVKDIRAFFWLPVLQLTADICVLLGTIVGFLSRGSLGRQD